MASGRSTSPGARNARAGRGETAGRTNETAGRTNGAALTKTPRIAPMYKRLPHGPHRLERKEVVLHQRARIHGAMVEAIAHNGYEGTSVKQVIGLAGVSRRSFYEQFANKEEGFLATFDLIVRHELAKVRNAYLGADGPLEERARAAFARFAEMAAEDRNAALLVVLEAQRVGPAGVLRVRRTAAICEQLLARAFAESPGATPLPLPIVRAIAGGLHGIASAFLRDEHAHASVDLAEEMLSWTMLFRNPAAERLSERMAAGLSARVREISSAHGHRLGDAEAPGRDERSRLLQAVLRLVAREDYRALSAPQIADEANVSIDAYCELFADKQECFLAALDTIGDELLTIAADPRLVSDEWPQAVRRVFAALTRHLADRPLRARTLAQEALFAGDEAHEHALDLLYSIATLLTEGAPSGAPGSLTADAVAGAIWHTLRCQVASGRIELLAALSDHLAYVVLAPFIGADAAVEIVTEELQPERPERVTGRDACETGALRST